MSVATEQSSLEKLSIDTIRTLSMDAVEKANSGHPGTPMALAPVAYALYTRVMKHDPEHPDWLDRDRFVLSAGHASMLLYSILHLTGYKVTMDDLKDFRQLGSPTAGHPERGHLDGIETTTGPLGNGISTAVGIALAERMRAARFNREQKIVDHHTFVIASDGDMQEGVQSEAASLAGHLGLGRLIAFYDDNHISIEGDTSISYSEDVGKRYEAYGWDVRHLGEDIEVERLVEAFNAGKAVEDRPTLIIARTHIGYGAPNKQDTGAAHGSALGDDEIEAAKKFYDFPSLEPFFVPDGVYDHYKELVAERKKLHSNWHEQFAAYKEAYPELAEQFSSDAPPEGWDADWPSKPADEKGMATRKASEAVIQHAAEKVPQLVGGSADLAGSTNTIIDGAGSISRSDYSGRNLHFGIREHGMGAVVNGLTISGFRAYGATFLTFSDYMKGAIRVGAIMHCPSIWVFTHDSIGLGEDGPTHQPIEQYAHLRATPNLNFIRPADFNETALAWRYALRNTDQPTALSLSRQNSPTLDPASVPDDAIDRGAYVLVDADPVKVVLIATGTEVKLAMEAAEQLEGARVVSMPCMEIFAGQDKAYQDSVIPPDVKARVAVEAASEFGWHRWVGDSGKIIAMHSYGASGPAPEVYEHFGITTEAVVEAAKSLV